MDVAESIKVAWAAVEESGVPEHMQELAFKESLRALLGASAPAAPAAKKTPPKPSGAGTAANGDGDYSTDDSVDEAAIIGTVSEETGVDIERLEKVFHVDNGVVKLLGVHTKWGGNTADKARNIAQVVTVVRRLGMQKPDTSLALIKSACDTKHAYDGKNFTTKHMTSVPGCVVKGEGSNRRLEAKGAAITAFPALVDKILGES